MRLSNDIFCFIGKRGAGKDTIADNISKNKVTISDILTTYCHQNNIEPNRDTLTKLGNTIFTGELLAEKIHTTCQQNKSRGVPIITGLRKPDTLFHLMKNNRCLLIGILADDYCRRQRVHKRNRLGDSMSYAHFMEHERQENSLPNKQNIDLLTAFCDIYITNNTSLHDAIQQTKNKLYTLPSRAMLPYHIDAQGYKHFTRAILINEHNEILILYDKHKQLYTLPGGKVDTGETPDRTIIRELQEEVGIKTTPTYCGSFLGIFRDGLGKGHFFETTVCKQDIKILEPDIHTDHMRIPRNQLQQTIGFESFLDSGLYHYTYNNRVKNWDIHWEPNIADSLYKTPSHYLQTLTDISSATKGLQYIDLLTNTLHIQPRTQSLQPHHLPLRIMTYGDIYKGICAQGGK